MVDVVGDIYARDGYRFVPLVRKEVSLSCSLRILCLRRDTPTAVLAARDIDNRVKTLIDALTLPMFAPIDDTGALLPPGPEEDPFFVLLDDDRQVTHLEVEADTALAVNPANPSDESFVRVLIAVSIRPIDVTMFNLSFA